jgi:two-component system, sensor histidine kinase YesM
MDQPEVQMKATTEQKKHRGSVFSLQQILPRRSLQYRVLFYFLILIFIPTILILLVIYHLYLQFMIDKIQLYTYQMVKEINRDIDSNLMIYRKLTMQIYANQEIIENLEKSHLSLEEQWANENAIRRVLQGLINSDRYVTSAYLITDDGTKYADGIEFPAIMDQLGRYKQEALSGDGRPVWLPTENIKNYYGKTYSVFEIVRQIKSVDGTAVGILILILREDLFTDIYRDIYFGDHVKKLVLSEDYSVVSSSGGLKTGFKISRGYRFLKNAVRKQEGSFIQQIGTQKYLVVFSTSAVSSWRFVSVIPLTELLREVVRVKNIMLLIIVLFVVFLLLLLYIFSSRITLPLKNLLKGIKKVEQGNFDISINNDHNDEIGELSRSFDTMVQRVNRLVQEVKEQESFKAKAEIAALESQVNPHFMYNTLNSIKWMAVLNKQDNIKNMINALIVLLKNTVKGNQGLITIREEIELLESYIFIQSMRFRNFKTVFHAPDELLDYKIMKFTLQPIIENSIIHGFGSLDKMGEITVSFANSDSKLVIVVKDNGAGIKEDEIGQIISKERDFRFNQVGLNNLHHRIVLNYGENYGLRIDSQYGEGTTVEITLPLLSI